VSWVRPKPRLERIDKLPRRSARTGVVAAAPRESIRLQHRVIDIEAAAVGEGHADTEIGVLVRCEKDDSEPKSVGERELLLEGVRHVHQSMLGRRPG
jgi:hypothetical protein